MEPSEPPEREAPPNATEHDLQRPRELQLVDEGDLDEFERTKEAEHLARLAADRALLDEMQWSGFEGPGWSSLARALAEYGYPVVRAWLLSGRIVQKCREKLLQGVEALPPDGLPVEACTELAGVVVTEALVSFHSAVLKQHKWDDRRGATLKSYFVGHCCIRFVGVFRRWRRDENGAPRAHDLHRIFELDPSAQAGRQAAVSPDRALLEESGFQELLSSIDDPTTRTIFRMQVEGYRREAIAEALGLTVAAVDSRIYAYRKKNRGHRRGDVG